ncbi:NADH:flavin oxidoreductase/NADH oxidase [Devosia oryziradicis]|uniref:NADH:flavin oxidoreductase/NADH oxidase n=1 Tax=Devosia oryziradicis TaxID=2801335 RepID=A0ABX7BRM5_9HYPH|nr:NADH:flavin oxidoreductase/NADH oxidase [Devosia oryziradicis]QQR34567.1 NADH:flavin oxidoreductase/NADH oxidase [Devosia oryziradicis]
MSKLFSPAKLAGLTLRNRTVVAPMCQYSSQDGFASDWHLVHLGRFALGGFGLVMLEATAVTPEGRISYADLGLWKDEHIAPLSRIVDFLHGQGAAAGIQLAHAGRKASTPVHWRNGFDETEEEKVKFHFESWTPVAPSAVIHAEGKNFTKPEALDDTGIQHVIDSFVAAARRADRAGFDTVEIHAAHGYLLNQFLSPLANKRTDRYGGSRENRMRLVLEVTEAVRAVWPAEKPLLARLSVTDWHPDGWQVEDSIALTRELKARGVDAIDASSGGFDGAVIPTGAAYQVPLASAVRNQGGMPTMAVGLLGDAQRAEEIIANGEADFIALARGALDDPNWPVHIRHELGLHDYDLWPRPLNRVRERDRSLHQRGFAKS